MNERTYRILGQAGVIGLVSGILIMTVGLAVGILSVVAGARALDERKNLMI